MASDLTNPIEFKTQSAGVMPDINKIIELVSEHDNISDIHMSSDAYVSFRINGEIVSQLDW